MSRLYIFHQLRIKNVINILTIFSVILLIRYFYIQILNASEYSEEISHKIEYRKNIKGERGNIYDRNGIALAVNITKVDLWINTAENINEKKIVDFFIKWFDIDSTKLLNQIRTKKKRYLPIKKNIIVDNIEKIKLEVSQIKGLNIDEKRQRFYPFSDICSQLIGYVNNQGEGQSGIEFEYNSQLKGQEKSQLLSKSLGNKFINRNKEKFDIELYGNDIYLTIDIVLQTILFSALEKGQHQSLSKSANGILLDPHTGQILAMASSPAFDPNNYSKYPIENFKNNIISNQYEPGSTIKVISILNAITKKDINKWDLIDCENGEYILPGSNQKIHDHEPNDNLSIEDVLVYSSNIGIAKISNILGDQLTYNSYRNFGLGIKTYIDLPGEEKGILRKLKNWSKNSNSMISIGQELSVTDLQLAMIYSAIANGGYLLKPQIINNIQASNHTISTKKVEVIRKVAIKEKSKILINILDKVVTEGTGTNANIDGYSIAGKTGTAEKFINGEYSDREFVSSFASIFPSNNPKYVCIVSVDSPEYYKHWGNETAAPIVKEVFINIINKYFENDKGII